jgi:ABC-type oligopeptide transport system substrate-binding subunit
VEPDLYAEGHHQPRCAGPDLASKPLGSGPYRVVELRLGDRLILERNPEYWDPPRREWHASR